MSTPDRVDGQVTIRIDLAAIRHNMARVRAMSKSKILAIVRADAFGHGVQKILPALADADALGVTSVIAAVALRHRGEQRTIVVLHGFKSNGEITECASHSLTPVIHNLDQLEMLKERAQPGLKCWAQFDTGCGWTGL